ncbi:MAG: sigma-70 family RNA polymerase sigma factor [Myxococcaceae bacterium]|nr:sigma-70 family RNA polymerase sigma factor [Myxococcaceae bacterium]
MPELVASWVELLASIAGAGDDALRPACEAFVARDRVQAERIDLARVRARYGERGQAAGEAPTTRAWDDLILCVCFLGADPRAAQVLHERLAAAARAGLGRYCLNAAELAEFTQRTAERVLVDRGGGPKLLEYSGRGPLDAWLRVVAVRTHLNALPGTQVLGSDELERCGAQLIDSADPELDAMRTQARSAFQDALQRASGALEPEERVLLRKRFLAGQELNAIAEQDQVDRATVVRRLARARERLKTKLLEALGSSLGLQTTELQSLLKVLGSNPGLNLEEALRSIGR